MAKRGFLLVALWVGPMAAPLAAAAPPVADAVVPVAPEPGDVGLKESRAATIPLESFAQRLSAPARAPLALDWEKGGIPPLLTAILGTILAAGILAILAIKHVPESRLGRWLLLERRLSGGASDLSLARHEKLIGERGVALTDLRPSGRVVIGGRRYDAICEVGYIGRGTPIVVQKGRGFSLVVAAEKGSS